MALKTYWWLLAVALAVVPWLRSAAVEHSHPWLELAPVDWLSRGIDGSMRAAGSLAIAAIALGLAGLHLQRPPVERISRGAEVVILLDKSRSMDQPLADGSGFEAWAIEKNSSKSSAARRMLREFVDGRPDDRFAFMMFSTLPIPVFDLTGDHQAVRAAIEASSISRGLSETDMGLGLSAALRMFDNRPYIGSRIVLLVSDGGAHLDVDTRNALIRQLRKQRAALYWIYLRSARSPGLLADQSLTEAQAETVPEHALHKFFDSTGAPYRAYQAENPDAMKRAIDDIAALEDRPLRYTEQVPEVPLQRQCFAVALGALLLLSGFWLANLWLVARSREALRADQPT